MYRVRLVTSFVALGLMTVIGRPAIAQTCVGNPIAVENCLPGNPSSEWDVSGAGDTSIQGFATDISVNPGQTVSFKIDTDASAYQVDIYRLGYYGGMGARKVASNIPVTATLPQSQPACESDDETGLVDCGNWAVSTSWAVPGNATSGIYIAKLTRTDNGGSSHIVFMVRDDTSHSDLLFKTSDATWQAYNVYGGNSLYVGSVSGFPSGHAPKVSYNRPFFTRGGGGGSGSSEDWLFNAEYPMVRFLEANGYDVTYTTDVDADRNGGLIVNHKAFLSVGHDEYWSAGERAAVEAARDAGVHLAFFSGNEVYWKTRWEPSADGTATPYRTLVCYKEGTLGENQCGGKCDTSTNVWTGLWRDGCAFPLSDGCRPENALTGQISWDGSTGTLQIPDTYKNLRFWRNTAVATLPTGQTLNLTPGTLGYEWDWQQYTEHYPAGRVLLSTTVFNGKTHHLSLYRAPGGALVFGAGTVQWSWGLDSNHDRGSAAPSLAMQQATVNLLADMGVQPVNLQTGSGLVAATASGDTTPPVSTIGFPAPSASLPAGTPVTITGSATDSAGIVAGVEMSVDGGTTWHAATGTTSWSYSWTPGVTGSVTLKSRAYDDLGNLQATDSGPNVVAVTVTEGSPSGCPCTIFGTEAPSAGAVTDNQPIEVGVKFRASVAGQITGVRFYKGVANTGTHIGHLWTALGEQLAEATFTNETSEGWQTVSFSSPVSIIAGTTYVASYHSTGYFSDDVKYFTSAKVSGPLTAIANTDPDGGNGVYIYSASSAFPVNSPPAGANDAPNYWVDVVFEDPGGPDQTPPTVTATTPGNNATAVATNTAVTATFGEALDPATVTTATFELRDPEDELVPAAVGYDDSSRTTTLTPGTLLTTSTVYTARLVGGGTDPRIKDVAGNALASNYVWSFTTAAPDSTPPTVTSTVPASGAGGVAPTVTVSAVFSEPLSPSTVNGTTFELRNAANALVSATVSYNIYTHATMLAPSSALATGTYTARLAGGGTDPRIKDLAGNALATDVTWSFTVADFNCPCTIWSPATLPGTAAFPDARPLELGVKFRASVDGYVTGVRFYKGLGNTGTHVGNLWSGTGTLLASATFTGEESSGWQEVSFGAPVAITAETTYVASYHTNTGYYAEDTNYFSSAVDNPPLRALGNGEDGPNGVYAYSATSVFPTSEYSSSNYWVDVVFATTVGPDVTPPVVVSHVPASDATAVPAGTSVAATFNEAIDGTTVDGDTFELRDGANALVSASVTYSAATRTATLAPASALAYSTTYTATLKGGTAGARIEDLAGNALADDVTWSFTTSDPPPPPPTEGPGGPILVISAAANPFSRYFVEILRAEGLNEFFAMDMSQVTAGELANYDVVILGEMPLTSEQVTMLDDWTNAGGTLVAMRPDAQLAGLLGITPAGGTLANQYLLVDTATAPGLGIVGQTIQFHGTADLYTLNGATALATLYSNATTATGNPAVTTHNVGSSGGKAVAFTYDLARSVVYTRQGNPAWKNQKRDGAIQPIRSDDLFYGNASFDPQPDWVDLNKVAIPQADEQQRLLANVITLGNLHRKPLPRFWYLPKGLKAAIVMTGDNHGDGGMQPRFDIYIAESPVNCSVEDWECVRATGYEYVGSTFTNAQAILYHGLGFEVALHVDTGCASVPAEQYETATISQLAVFGAAFPGIPLPQTHRTHCIAWTDWSAVAELESRNGLRLDTNYYYWPYAWFQGRSGMFTGSGIPMRFAKEDGTIVDNYQATTQMTDDSLGSFTSFTNDLLDRAQGPEGYYGVFTCNLHFDNANHPGSNDIVAIAQAHGVPVVSAKQMLDWLDGRNNSSFANLVWSGNTLSFTIVPATGSRNMRAMVPTTASVGQLTGITRNATPVPATTQTIKGIEYAFFAADAGDYVATYLVDLTAPLISGVVATPHDDGTATITWTTNEPADSSVDYGTIPVPLGLNVTDAALVTSHSVTLTGLSASTTYYYRVTSTDAATNPSTSPVPPATLTFATPAPVCFVDDTAAQFGAGTPDANTVVTTIGNGELRLKPAKGAEFATLPPTTEWQAFALTTGGTATVTGGQLVVDGARFNSEPISATWGPGSSVEFEATFSAAPHEYIGFGGGDDAVGGTGMFYGPPWAMFGTGTAGAQVIARVYAVGGSMIDYAIPLSLLGTPHRYRIDWKSGPDGFDFYVDDALVHSETITLPAMRVAMSDLDTGGPTLLVDWVRITPYPSSGSFVSRVYDAGTPTGWDAMSWTATLPTGTSVQMYVRQGDTATPDTWWTPFIPVASSGTVIGGTSRYVQYRADLATSVPTVTPVIASVHVSCATGPDTTPPAISNVTATSGVGGTSAVIAWGTNELATSRVDYGAAPDALLLYVTSGTLVGTHILALPSLTPNTTYYYRVTSADGSNNTTVEPPPLDSDPLSFTTSGTPCASDATAADFSAGTPGATTYVSETSGGEVILKPAEGAEFSGTTLPAGWMTAVYGGSPAVVGDGHVSVDGAYAATTAFFGPGRSVEFVATFDAAAAGQHVGFGSDLNAAPWAIFSTALGGILQARSNGGTETNETISSVTLGEPHRFRIDWTGTQVVYAIDGTTVTTHTVSIASMRPIVSDGPTGGNPLLVDWMRMTPYAASGSYTSRVFDAGGPATWGIATWSSNLPSGTSLAMFEHHGNTPVPDGSWSSFAPIPAPGTNLAAAGRFVQYRADLTTSDPTVTPALLDVAIACTSTPDSTAPVISGISATPGTDGVSATIAWTTDELANSRVDYGTSPGSLTANAAHAAFVTSHSLSLTGLSPNTTYYYRVTSTDVSTNTATSPLSPATLSFATPAALCPSDVTGADFGLGTLDANTVISMEGDGELILKPSGVMTEFSGASLPGDWSSATYVVGQGSVDVTGGALTVDGARAYTNSSFGPGRSLEFVATLTATSYQNVGFAGDGDFNNPWVVIGQGTVTDGVYARLSTGASALLSSTAFGSPHRYRIDWRATTNDFVFYVDGALVATPALTLTVGTPMVAIVSDYNAGGTALSVDWLRVGPYAASGNFVSRVFDGGGPTTWGTANWTASVPSGTALAISARTGNTATPDETWSSYDLLSNGAAVGANSRYVQYRADLTSAAPGYATPVLQDLAIGCASGPDGTPPLITNVVATPAFDGQSAVITWTTDERATSRVDYGTSSSSLSLNVSDGASVRSHSLTLTGLTPGTIYHYRVRSVDASGNSATEPNPPASPLSFLAPMQPCFVDSNAADFGGGTQSSTAVSLVADGEVILAPALGAEFEGASLPAGWTSTPWSGGTSTVSGGQVAVDGARLTSPAAIGYTAGRVLEFVATFGASTYQNAGFGAGNDSIADGGMFATGDQPWAMFGTVGSSTNLYARLNPPYPGGDVDLGTGYIGAPHTYRIEWRADNTVEFFIDGVSKNTRVAAFGAITMRPGISDYFAAAPSLQLDWIRVTPYASTGTFISRVYDSGTQSLWGGMSWTADVPAGTDLAMSVRKGNTPTSDDGSWSAWADVSTSGSTVGGVSRYIQYRAVLTANAGLDQTPSLQDVSLRCGIPACTGDGDCDDGDACTTDTCDPATGCQHAAICTVSGTVYYYRDNTLESGAGGEPSLKGVENVGIGAIATGPALVTTGGTGAYVTPGLQGNVTITSVNKYGDPRASDHRGAITSMDAARLAMAAVGNGSLSVNQKLAGDVTGNGTTTALDASLVARFAVGLVDHFPVAVTNLSDWRFLKCVPYGPPESPGCGAPTYDFGTITQDETGKDLYAILYGDVTGNWPQVEALAAAEAGGGSSASKPAEPLSPLSTVLSMPDTEGGGPGSTVFVPISATPGDGILGLDMTIQYDPAVVSATSVAASGIAATGFGLVANLNTPGVIIISLFATSSPMAGSGEIARIEFHVAGAPGATSALTFTRALINEGAIGRTLDPGLFTVTCAGVANGTACDDGNACTTVDHCSAGVCTGTAVTAPAEVAGVSFQNDRATISWNASADVGAVYDVVRGHLSTLPVGPGGGDELCAANDLTTTTFTDTDPVAPGEGLWYLVRVANSCALGTYGNDAPPGGPPSARVTTTCQ